jgi:hypothetical protein
MEYFLKSYTYVGTYFLILMSSGRSVLHSGLLRLWTLFKVKKLSNPWCSLSP